MGRSRTRADWLILTLGIVLGAMFSVVTVQPAYAGHNWAFQHWHSDIPIYVLCQTPPPNENCGTLSDRSLTDRTFDACCDPGRWSWEYYTRANMDWFGYLYGHNDTTNWLARVHYENMAYLGISQYKKRDHVTCGITGCSVTHYEIYWGHVRIDSAPPTGTLWYKGQGSPNLPSVQYDMWSTVTHELGHQIRLLDLPSDTAFDSCTHDGNRATMCPHLHLGTTTMRTPNTSEDINSANAGY